MNVYERMYWQHQGAIAAEYERQYAPVMKDRKRGWRRHHRRRMVARAERILRLWWPRDQSEEMLLAARRLADNLAVCSCPACGNPRRHFGQRTLAERRAQLGSN